MNDDDDRAFTYAGLVLAVLLFAVPMLAVLLFDLFGGM